jgi:hypothetical protein
MAQHVIAWNDVLSFDLLALGSVSITNLYVCTYLILCFALTAMLTSSRMGSNRSYKDTNPTYNLQYAHNATLWNVGINDASEYCFINSLTEVTEAFWFEVLILLTLCSRSPNVLHIRPVMLICDRAGPEVRAIHSFSFTLAQIRMKYRRLINYQPYGLHASRTLRLHLYTQTAELCKKRRISCLGNLYRVSLHFSTGYEILSWFTQYGWTVEFTDFQ